MKKTLGDAANRSEILARLTAVRTDSPRQWGRMTPHQMIRHLHDAFLSVMGGDGPVVMAKTPLPRGLMRWMALDLQRPWPKDLKTMPPIDQVLKGAPPPAAEFPEDVRALEVLVARVSSTPRDFKWRAHPFFGEMSDAQWMRWGWLHMDHHFRQFGV
jgi:Protein of unknown function (DUF1569)